VQRAVVWFDVQGVLGVPSHEAATSEVVMQHERLPFPVPQLCEECFGPVADVICGGVVATRGWPGTQGLRVFLHSACFVRARVRMTGR
jgi:hypothetical protein